MNVDIKKLKHSNLGSDYEMGYRIVYFYDNRYSIGEYCKSIEEFMIGFSKYDPVMDDNEIPEFISTTDLLNRYLKEMNDIVSVALYDVNGICIKKIDKKNNN